MAAAAAVRMPSAETKAANGDSKASTATIGANTSAIMPITASILARSARRGASGALATRSAASSPEMVSQANPPRELARRHHDHRRDQDQRRRAVEQSWRQSRSTEAPDRTVASVSARSARDPEPSRMNSLRRSACCQRSPAKHCGPRRREGGGRRRKPKPWSRGGSRRIAPRRSPSPRRARSRLAPTTRATASRYRPLHARAGHQDARARRSGASAVAASEVKR